MAVIVVMVVATMIKYKMTMEKVIKTYADHLLIEVDGAEASSRGNDAEQVENPVQLHFGIPIRALWRKQHYNDGLPWWWY